MALTSAGENAIRNAAPNRGGLGTQAAEAMLSALRSRNNATDVLEPHAVLKATVTATAANHIAYAGACKLYGAYVNSPAAAVLGSIVRFYDGATVPVASRSVQPGEVASIVFDPAVNIATDLRAYAAKIADGTTTPDSGDNPDVTLIVGY